MAAGSRRRAYDRCVPDSPLAASPYEVLRVASTVSNDELRKAYRRRLRETHPDAGGSAAGFHAVQAAWELVGTPESRAAYDSRGLRSAGSPTVAYAPRAPRPRADSRPQARSSGHPGGWFRERYLAEVREWAGRGVVLPDPYDPALVRSAPREVKHLLAAAIAEEQSARELATLGIGYTLWHDVQTLGGQARPHRARPERALGDPQRGLGRRGEGQGLGAHRRRPWAASVRCTSCRPARDRSPAARV